MSIQKKKSKNDDLTFALEHSKQNIRRQALLAVLAILVAAILCVSMTVAWYSNILHTSDMVFKAKEWNFKFSGDIFAANGDVVEISPGQTGVVHLQVSNTSGIDEGAGEATDVTPIGVNVNIEKENMGEMQKRLYFYVDKQDEINGEKVSRLYLSSEDGYVYTLYPGQTLKLSDEFYNNHRIYWYWVNDVVGYYFRGTVTSSNAIIEEVIRPVEYDYDNAAFNDNKELATVNGMPTTEFIKTVLKTDGYKGSDIKTQKVGNKVYYQISVEENYGIWMYLCTEDEIKENMTYDASLADSTNPFNTFKAKFVLTGQQVNLNPTMVGSQNELKAALSGTDELIQLSGNMQISSSLPVSGEKVLDLNGHTLTVDMGSGYGLTTKNGSLSVINGNVVSSSKDTSFIKAVAGEVYVDNVIVNGFYEGVVALDNDVTEDSHVFITNSTINTSDTAVWVKGNGSVSATPTTVLIENSILNSSEYIAITGSGNDDMAGVDLQIMNSTVTGHYAAVYHPMPNSSMYAYDTNFEGMVGIAVKAGKVHLVDCRVHGNDANPEEAKYEGSGFTQTGDAVYVEDSYVVQHGYELSLIVDGSKTSFTSSKGKALRMFKDDSTVAKIVVLGGKFSSDVSAFLPKDSSRVCVNESGMFVVKISE